MRRGFNVHRVGASFVLASSLLATAASAADPCPPHPASTAPEDLTTARKHMAAGVAFMQDPEGARCEEAYPQFAKAYELSGSLNALQNMAICAAKLELDGEAIACFERYLERKGADIAAEDKQQVENDLRGLKAAIAHVTFSSDLPGVTIQDTRTPRRGPEVRNTYKLGSTKLRLGVHPGDHSFVAQAKGHPDQKWTIELKSGDKLSKEFLFDVGKPVTAEGFTESDAGRRRAALSYTSEPATNHGLPASFWVAGSLTLAAATGWAVTGALALKRGSEYEATNTLSNAVAGVDLAREHDDVKALNLSADVLMGVTLAGAVTTVVLGLTSSSVEPSSSAHLTLLPVWTERAVGASLVGQF
ncbi:MAG: hypothetical protein FJ095_00420 [Deltaproteobacteria bacterium]|nr:hypothetical protein [Deltaproteobacteria bacterium]